MREIGLPGVFFYTGNFFENSVLRGHVQVRDDGELEFKQPIILEDTKCAPHLTQLIRSGDALCREGSRAVRQSYIRQVGFE
jgi:hypothetical protein